MEIPSFYILTLPLIHLYLNVLYYLQAVVHAMQADKLTYFGSLGDIEQRITEKVAEVEQSDEVNDIEFKAWLDNIKHEIDAIDSDLFKLEINIHPELLAEGLEELRNMLKPLRTEENKSEESLKLVDKMSNELNNHYDHQLLYLQ